MIGKTDGDPFKHTKYSLNIENIIPHLSWIVYLPVDQFDIIAGYLSNFPIIPTRFFCAFQEPNHLHIFLEKYGTSSRLHTNVQDQYCKERLIAPKL